jgi:hypothetical protein
MSDVTPQTAVADEAPVAGDIAARIAHAGHQPLIAHRKRGSTRYLVRHAQDIKAIWIDERLDPAFREQLMLAELPSPPYGCETCSMARLRHAHSRQGLGPLVTTRVGTPRNSTVASLVVSRGQSAPGPS